MIPHAYHWLGTLPLNIRILLGLTVVAALYGARKLAGRIPWQKRRDTARDQRLAQEVRAARRDQHMARVKRLPDETVSRIVAGLEVQVAGCDDAEGSRDDEEASR